MYDMKEALALIRKYSEEHVPLRKRIWAWLTRVSRTLLPVVAGFWMISTTANEGLTIIVPGDTDVSVQFTNPNGALVEYYPDDGSFARGEFTYRYSGLTVGTTYLITLSDRSGAVIERARIVASYANIELHYVTTTQWWQESRSGVA